jgi:tetratricopeptide (TPR) repeat protein
MRLPSLLAVASTLICFAPLPLLAQDEAHPAAEVEPAEESEAQGDNADPMQQRLSEAEQHLDDEAARRHFEAGRSLYSAGRFELAGDEFEEAYRLSNRAELLYNAYVAYRDANERQKAADALRRFLAGAGDVSDRMNLEARLRALEEGLAQEREQQQRVEQGPPEPNPGMPAGPEEADEEPAGSPVPWIVGGLGVAAIGVGIATGLMASGKESDIADSCPDDRCPRGFDLEGERSSADTLVLLTDVLLLGGAALLATGVVLLFALDDDDQQSAPSVGLGCTPHGCAGNLRVSF